jgi:hypothetical protein
MVEVMERIALRKVLTSLKAAYGPPEPPPFSDPWHYIVWENIAYLANDERRAKAFESLRNRIGLAPQELLDAPADELLEAASRRIPGGLSRSDGFANVRSCARRIRWRAAQIPRVARAEGQEGPAEVPGIGAPGADKILLVLRTLHGAGARVQRLRVPPQAGLRRGHGETTRQLSAVQRSMPRSCRSQSRASSSASVVEAHGKRSAKSSKPRMRSLLAVRGVRRVRTVERRLIRRAPD